jgi:hypothetical protein
MVTPPQIDASVPLRPSKIQIVLNVDGRLDQSNQHLTAQMRILLRTVVGQARNDTEAGYTTNAASGRRGVAGAGVAV